MSDTRKSWECDEWNDHPALGKQSKMGAGVTFGAGPLLAMDARGMTAAVKARALAGQPVGSDAYNRLMAVPVVPDAAIKESLWEKIVKFVAHPIKTIQAAQHKQSAMHGLPSHNATLASSMDQPSFFAGNKSPWWEGRIGDTARPGWDETK